MRAGVHCSVRGGFASAAMEASALGCDTLQMFSQSPRGWRSRVYTDDEYAAFRREREKAGLDPVVVHAPYLPNLCTSDPILYRRSGDLLKADLERCEKLGAEYLVIHPGSYSEGSSLEAGLDRLVDAVNEAFDAVPGRAMLLIENMAGGGRRVAGPFSDIARVLSKVRQEKRIGMCLDTCHTLAAGHDIATSAGALKVLAELDREVGLDRVPVLHVNDSKAPLGSHRDMHQSLGKGHVGLAGLKTIVSHPGFKKSAFILETPKLPIPRADRENLSVLRGFWGKS